MRRGIGRYVSKGYGGSATAARRMGSTARVAGNLAGALSGGIPGGGAAINARLEELRGKSAKEIINGIIDVVAPVDGTQDSEASRESVCEVLSELLDQRPDTDLLNLDDDSRSLVIERFVAADVYRRIFLDIGKKIQDAAPSAAVGLQRLRQVKDYVRETVKAAFAKVKSSGGDAQASVVSIARRALRATFEVFEAYAE